MCACVGAWVHACMRVCVLRSNNDFEIETGSKLTVFLSPVSGADLYHPDSVGMCDCVGILNLLL